MRVLIIGCGYIGISLGTRLISAGHEVYGLSRSGSTPELASSTIIPITADITRPETLAPISTHFDWVVLCVASSGGGLDDYQRIYLEGSRNVLNWLGDSPPQKLLYTSSTSVYGQVDGSVVDETSPTAPTSPNSQILVQTENLLLRQNQTCRVPALVLRLAGIYGPGRGYWLKQYLKGEARIEAGGARYLNMIHREDVVGATITALEIAPPGQVFNVVDDEPVTQLDYFEWLSQRLRRDMPPPSTEFGQLLSKRGFTNKRVRNAKLKNRLHYCLRYPTFREGYEVEIRRLEQEPTFGRRTNDKRL